jgi:hypothetical protein
MADLTARTWKLLLRLSAEDLSPQGLAYILSHDLHGIKSLDELSEEQALAVIQALESLPKLKEILWQSSINAIESEQANHVKPLSKVEAIAVTEAIIPAQIDALASQLIKHAKIDPFAQPENGEVNL